MPAHSRTRLAVACHRGRRRAHASSARAPPPCPPTYEPGADGAGDPYFPLAGNGGIDVVHYDLDLDYTPPAAEPAPLDRDARRRRDDRTGRHRRSRSFNLDLRGLAASQVIVNGKKMAFRPSPATSSRIIPPPKLKTGTDRDRRRHLRRHDDAAHSTSRAPSTAGSRRATARWSSASRTARRPGSRSTTIRPTSRPTPSRSRCPMGSSRSRTACSRARRPVRTHRPGRGTPPTRWPRTSPPRRSATSPSTSTPPPTERRSSMRSTRTGSPPRSPRWQLTGRA